MLKEAELLRHYLLDGTKEWQDTGEKICSIYRKEYESCRTTETFAKAAWLWYINSGEDCQKSPSLEAQDASLDLRRSPAQPFDVKVNTNVTPNIQKSRMEAVPDNNDD